MAREMKDSGIAWIGEIPREWSVSKIKHHFNVVSGATPKSEVPSYWDGDIPWITPADYKTQDKYVSGGRKSLTRKGYDSCGTVLVPKGSIVFSKRAPVGTVAIAQNELCTNQGCLSCVVKDDSDCSFFYYAMSAFTKEFELVSVGTTFKEIGADVFANFRLSVPCAEEQRRIADYLDAECGKIDAVIEQTRVSIEEYKKLKQAVITQAVTKGIRGKRPMKDSGIIRWGRIPLDWKMSRVKRFILSFSSGLSAVTGDETTDESGKYVLRTSAVSTGSFISTEVKPVLLSAVDRLICPVESDVLIVSRMNTSKMVGACAYVEKNVPNTYLPDKLWKIKLLSVVETKYFWYSLNSTPARAWFSELSTGASDSMQNISMSDFVNNCIPVPPKAEQKEIVSFLDAKCSDIDRVINSKQELISALTTYKQSLIYEYVTGKKEAPVCQ